LRGLSCEVPAQGAGGRKRGLSRSRFAGLEVVAAGWAFEKSRAPIWPWERRLADASGLRRFACQNVAEVVRLAAYTLYWDLEAYSLDV
jgi:hypothetical protein